MTKPYSTILREHLNRYPLMQGSDLAKLLYQAEFGPRHLAPNTNALLQEWQSLLPSPPSSPLPAEEIGGGLCRFHLTAGYAPAEAAPLLSELVQMTTQYKTGSLTGLQERAGQLGSLLDEGGQPDLKIWLANWLQDGAPTPHHSEAFRQAYQPHYRLLKREYAGFFPALLACRRKLNASAGGPLLISIDGRCGSGKTSLAGLLAQIWPQDCRVIHLDDFYLPLEQRQADWQQTPAANLDLPRLQREVLWPALAGAAIVYRPYDCQTAALTEPRKLPPAKITIIEGSYSQLPQLAAHYALKIFLTISPAVQAARLQAREGGYYPAFVERWIPLEEKYLRQCGTEKHADLIIKTDQLF